MKARGFSIIEVVVAVAIFSIVMLCSLSFFSFSNNIMRRAREQDYALRIAKNEILTCKIACVSSCPPFRDPTEQPVIRYHVIPELGLTYCSDLGWNQAGSDFGTPVNTYADWYKVVTVTVTWNSTIDRSTNSVSLHTMATVSPFHK
jgi:prepilin-type N-terminal cleavage/methylation domain-containing protein